MAITYSEEKRQFRLDSAHTSYLIGVTQEGYVGHINYGSRVSCFGGEDAFRLCEVPGPGVKKREKCAFLASFPFEYPTAGVGDFRDSCLDVANEYGQRGCELFYDSYRIETGKPALPGLPATFAGEDETDVQTLFLVLRDPVLKLKVTLLYSVFEKEDAITRSAIIENEGTDRLVLHRVGSACLDMDNRQFETLTLEGAWARERHMQRGKLLRGRSEFSSVRGVSSPQMNPFLALVTPETTQKTGEVYAMNFVYSGNFAAVADLSMFGSVRMTMGIHPLQFAWNLRAGESFTAPETVMVYSGEGLGKMTRSFHNLYRKHLIRSPYRDKDRPVLINNWEGTYFDFTSEKLIEIAKAAKSVGVEMFVMDDGWFGRRDSDDSGLGDWYVNEKKLAGGLTRLGQEIHALGMKFGIWIEPEMVSPDSGLFRAHPDWAIQIDGREPSLSRHQLVLNITRKEVRDAVCGMIRSAFQTTKIDYVKWDMNRYLCDIGSAAGGMDAQGELMHRYVLAVYEMQERLITDFPDILFENCSSGGARFDPGMLYYSPQIWTSDDTDGIERLHIQEGTALVYPMETMGAHVSKCPNEQVGRMVPIETRANVALAGTFGYELDMTRLPEEEKKKIPGQIARYHRFHALVAGGDYYRLNSWCEEEPWDCWENAAEDGEKALVTYVQVLGRPNAVSRFVRLEGLDPQTVYCLTVITDGKEEKAGKFSGDALMHFGLRIPPMGDFQSALYYFEKITEE